MGCKDDKWREAPGYCVECDNLRPLNAAAVCEACWKAGPSGEEDWEEHSRSSAWHYARVHQMIDKAEPTPYVFVTDEGFTHEPGSESAEPEVENLQVLGIAFGGSAQTAFRRLLAEQPWIATSTFSRAFCWKLAPGFRNSIQEFQIQ